MKLRAQGGLIAVSCWLSAAAMFVACSGNDGARGTPGTSAIVKSTAEPPGDSCPAGGFVIVSGVDTDGDGKLVKGEATTQYACNGVSGDAGTPGETGQDGVDGPKGDRGDPGDAGPQGPQGDAGPKGDKGNPGDAGPKGDKGDPGDAGPKGGKGDPGDAGANGLNALVSIEPEPSGPNCRFGGLRVRSGLDANRDGQLSDTEAGPAQYVCNGAPETGSGGAATGGSAGSAATGGSAALAGDGGAVN